MVWCIHTYLNVIELMGKPQPITRMLVAFCPMTFTRWLQYNENRKRQGRTRNALNLIEHRRPSATNMHPLAIPFQSNLKARYNPHTSPWLLTISNCSWASTPAVFNFPNFIPSQHHRAFNLPDQYLSPSSCSRSAIMNSGRALCVSSLPLWPPSGACPSLL